MFTFVSDIEDLSVEWETDLGGKYWQTFSSQEEMSKALRENEEFNDRPENKILIDKMNEQDNLWLAKCTLEYDFGYEHYVLNNIRMEFAPVVKYMKRYGQAAVDFVANAIVAHNKRVLKTQHAPRPAMNTIGDFSIFKK